MPKKKGHRKGGWHRPHVTPKKAVKRAPFTPGQLEHLVRRWTQFD